MTARALRDWLESGQIAIYFGAGLIALMLFVTFLQVSLAELGQAFARLRFLAALLAVNFIAVPLLVAVLIPFAPDDALIRLGVLLVLLYPCIDCGLSSSRSRLPPWSSFGRSAQSSDSVFPPYSACCQF